MNLIDTHAHIYLPEFDKDRADIVDRATAAGISAIYMPAIDSTTHQQMLQVAVQYKNCIAMMGLHPCSVKENVTDELDTVQQYLKEQPFAAVGEIGLDFYWDTTFSKAQYLAFETQVQWALDFNLPIVIHSRNALDECIAVVKNFTGIRGIFHCFSGTAAQAAEIMKLNFYLGIGGVVTYKNAGLDKVIAATGIDNLVLETDAPYLSPVPYRGKRNESAYLPLVQDKIANVCRIDKEEVAAVTTKNAAKVFRIK